MICTKLYYVTETKQGENYLESILEIIFKIKLFIERTWKEKLQIDNTSVKAMHRGKKKRILHERNLAGEICMLTHFG